MTNTPFQKNPTPKKKFSPPKHTMRTRSKSVSDADTPLIITDGEGQVLVDPKAETPSKPKPVEEVQPIPILREWSRTPNGSTTSFSQTCRPANSSHIPWTGRKSTAANSYKLSQTFSTRLPSSFKVLTFLFFRRLYLLIHRLENMFVLILVYQLNSHQAQIRTQVPSSSPFL